MVAQTKVDDLLTDFITEGLMPFSTVEMPSFQRLVKGLQPNRSAMCRATVTKRIDEKASIIKKYVKDAMAKVQQVATTTDCWTAHHRSFIGVTAHWIDNETLDRVSAVLACRRLAWQGRHTYDILAAKLEEIHTEYEIVSDCQDHNQQWVELCKGIFCLLKIQKKLRRLRKMSLSFMMFIVT